MIYEYKYKNRKIKHSDTMGWWMVLMPKDTNGNLEMKHFETMEECRNYIDKKHQEEEEYHCTGGYWYERYLA